RAATATATNETARRVETSSSPCSASRDPAPRGRNAQAGAPTRRAPLAPVRRRGHDTRVKPASAGVEVRSGELFAALSLALDLGTGEPFEHALRTCLIGLELADRLDLPADERRDVYHLSLLHSIGCTADSPEAAARYGDDIAVRSEAAPVDTARRPQVAGFIWRATGKSPRRFTVVMAAGPKGAAKGLRAHCEVGLRLAAMLPLPAPVRLC